MPYPVYDPDHTVILYPLLAILGVASRYGSKLGLRVYLVLLRHQLQAPDAWVPCTEVQAAPEIRFYSAQTVRKALYAVEAGGLATVKHYAGRHGNRVHLHLGDMLRHDGDQAFLQRWVNAVLSAKLGTQSQGAALCLLVHLAAILVGQECNAISIDREDLAELTGLSQDQVERALLNLREAQSIRFVPDGDTVHVTLCFPIPRYPE